MKENELIYTILELEEWCSKGARCSFCTTLYSDEDIAICQIRTRSKLTDKVIENDRACKRCREKFENGELSKCEDCGRLKTKINVNFRSGKYICNCVRNNEPQEKELPILPVERRQTAFYEWQINSLQEKLNEAEWTVQEEREAHEDFMEKSEEWGKRQKQELLDRIKELEAEVERLKKQTPQELLDEISKLKERVKELEQQTAQIEVKETKKWPWKSKK